MNQPSKMGRPILMEPQERWIKVCSCHFNSEIAGHDIAIDGHQSLWWVILDDEIVSRLPAVYSITEVMVAAESICQPLISSKDGRCS